jgi:glycosyltransferase involved in cell wall biosynthesis
MKVCIASVNFLETTFPLAKYISENKFDVSVICIFPKDKRRSYVIDYSDFQVRNGFDNRFFNSVFNIKLQEYLNKIKILTFFYTNIKNHPITNFLLAFKLARFISNQKFDIIHFIGSSPFLYILRIFLWRKKIVQTIHEVTIHEEGIALPLHQRLILNILCKRNIKLILHSEASKNRFIEYYSTLPGNKFEIDKRVHMIPFGLFETFKCFTKNVENIEEDATILFFGRFLPYKGLSYLLEAFKIVQNKVPHSKLIIAGEGSIQLENPQANLIIINKLLLNEELISLIKKSTAVICPYISASQSGIPMVAYLFGKPIIATNVGGLAEVVDNMKTGIIVPPQDSKALAKAMETIITKQHFTDGLKKNILNKYAHSDFSWQALAKKTIDVYTD